MAEVKPKADPKFKPKIGDWYFYLKPCGVVRGEMWTGHILQRLRVDRGLAPFKTAEGAKDWFKKHK